VIGMSLIIASSKSYFYPFLCRFLI
jgi:hypothetical protein